jgi:NADH-quinone oxidoreductase subunit E
MPTFSTATLDKAHEIIKRYPEGQQKSALIPLLHLAQREWGGYLTTESMDYVATLLNISPIEVYEVATFYSMYNMQPVGRYVLEVCRTGPCCTVGAERITEYISQKLGIKGGRNHARRYVYPQTNGVLGCMWLRTRFANTRKIPRTPHRAKNRRPYCRM